MIYFIQAEGVGNIKIGFTDGDPQVRLDQLQTGSPVPLRLLGAIPGTAEGEKDLHRLFASARVVGEWFKPVPELLALIAPADVLACGKVEVVECSVQIRVLTVGRKQFTSNLFLQLKVEDIVVWPQATPKLLPEKPGVIWGWLSIGKDKDIHVLWEFGGILRRFLVAWNSIKVPEGELLSDTSIHDSSYYAKANQIYDSYRVIWSQTVARWKSHGQLFLGA